MRAAGMADDTNTPLADAGSDDSGRGRRDGGQREGRQRDGGQREGGQRQGGQREAGGFRIRLSDNELQAARVLQEAFGLRSTVAVLGFALRTLAQQLEAGQLTELVAQQQALAGQRPAGTPAARAGGGGERDVRRGEGRGPGAGGGGGRSQRIDPFARPSRPAAPKAEPEVLETDLSEPEASEQEGSEAADAEQDLQVPAVDVETGSEPESASPDPGAGNSQNATAEPATAAVNPGDA